MEQLNTQFSVETSGEGFSDITSSINNWISRENIKQGIIIITLLHTSCSLIINENADPRVLKDLSAYLKAIVPEEGFKALNRRDTEKTSYLHSEEGLDDMPAHIKTALTSSSISLSIINKKLLLGTWQAIYLWEHRYSPHTRKVFLNVIGEIEAKTIAKSTLCP